MLQQPASSAPALDVESALRELASRDGRMAELCTENGSLRMDWVDVVGALLADDRPLVELQELADGWRRRGIRHVVWSGMGGSSVAVGVLAEFGLRGIELHVLDSTDPSALDALAARLVEAKQRSAAGDHLRALLEDVVLVAVSLGLTSEEPATHLAWFLELVAEAGLPADQHTLVLTVPGSRLEETASSRGVAALPVYLAGRGGLPGRMSAPGSSVFLLPVALGGRPLRGVLEVAWSSHDLAGAVEHPDRSAYVRLAEEIADKTPSGRCRLMLELPPQWAALHVWIEQLFEQTLGKDGKGIVVLPRQRLNRDAIAYRHDDLLVLTASGDGDVEVPVPDETTDAQAAVAAAMLGWQLTVALLGYRAGTNIVDEPAVEDYKSRARALRDDPDVLERALDDGALDWRSDGAEAIVPFVDALIELEGDARLSYLDVTINGELDASLRDGAGRRLHALGNDLLGVPVKLRRAPAAYHVSEQCQLDGPPGVVSLRVVGRSATSAQLGDYSPRFLHAQAVATWLAMRARGRACTLVVLDQLADVVDVLAATEELARDRLEAGA